MLCTLFMASAPLRAQSLFYVFDADSSRFPLVSAKFFAFDRTMRPVTSPDAADFQVIENGIPRAVTAVSCPAPKRYSLSAVLTIDVSTSMSDSRPGEESNMDLAKAAAMTWINTIALDNSECAVTSFDEGNYLNADFTQDRPTLSAAIAGLRPQGGTSYDAGFINAPAGSLQVAKRGRNKRIIIFLTDGQAGGSEHAIIDEALKNNITIYCVTLRTPTPEILQHIAARTGGRCFNNVETREEIERIYRIILQLAQSSETCRIEWMSGPDCITNRGVTLTYRPQGISTSVNYTAPAGSIPTLDLDLPEVAFGSVPPGGSRDTTVTVTAHGTPLKIVKVSSSSPLVTVSSPAALAGRALQPGETARFTLHYAPVDSAPTYARVEFLTDPPICSESFIYTTGGFPNVTPRPRAIELASPNGGEMLTTGEEMEVRWKGTDLDDMVEIEYSTDGGASWGALSGHGSGFLQKLKVPNTPSTRCLARVTHRRRADTLRTLRCGLGPIGAAAFSSDGARVVVTGSNVGGEIWDGTNGTFLRRAFDPDSPIRAAAIDNASGRVLTAANDAAARIWDIDRAAPILTLRAHTRPIVAAAFSPDGARVATGSEDSTMRIWNAATGNVMKTILTPGGVVRGMAFSPSGERLATIGSDDLLKVWNLASSAQPVIFLPPSGARTASFTSVAFSPDGKQVLASLSDGTARIWTIQSGALARTLAGHKGKVTAARYMPGGARVVTGGADGTARVWDVATGALLRTIGAHGEEISFIAVDPRDGRIITASHDGTAKIWEGDTTAEQDRSDNLWTIVRPALEIAASDIDFGAVEIGSRRDTSIAVMVRNVSSQPVAVDGVALRGPDASAFAIVAGGDPFMLAPGESHAMRLGFVPANAGKAAADLIFRRNGNGPLATATLHGVGAEHTLPVIAMPQQVTFAPLSCRETFTDQVIEIRNNGGAPLRLRDAAFTGSTSFSVFPIFIPMTIAPGESGKITIRFTPSDADAGMIAGALTIASNADNSPTFAVALEARRERVAITTTISEIDLGTVCPGTEATATLGIRNSGTIATAVRGTVNGPFAIDRAAFSIGSGEEMEIHLKLDASAPAGEQHTTLLLVDSICGIGLSVPVKVRVSGPALAWEPTHIVATAGTTATGMMELRNTSDRDITITSAAIADGRFAIASPSTPFVIAAGGAMPIAIRYAAADTGLVETALALAGDPCGFAATIPLGGVGTPVGTVVEIPTLEAKPGERVRVPVRIIESQQSFFGLKRKFSVTIRFNASLLEPVAGTPRGRIEKGERIITLTGERADGSPELLALEMTAALGDADSTPIHIDEFIWTDAGSRIATRDGLFRLDGICRAGGSRLITVGTAAALKESYPNPAGSRARIEFETGEVGTSRLFLIDPLGRRVMTAVEGDLEPGAHAAELDLTALPSGTYFYVLETPTERLSRRLEVRR